MDEFLPEIKACPCCGGKPEPFRRTTGQGHGESYNEVGIKCTSCTVRSSIEGYDGYEEDQRLLKAVRNWNNRT